MTPTDEATFIALWQQGLSHAAIAQQLGLPVGTVKSRASRLAHAGQLTPRPRGGARQQGKVPREDSPAPVQTLVQTTDTGAASMHSTSAVQLPVQTAVQPTDSDIEALRANVAALAQEVRALSDESRPAIYALIDPRTDVVCYVGASQSPAVRLQRHLYDPHSERMRAWIADLRLHRLRPQLRILERVSVDEDIGERETAWIVRLRGAGMPLLNVSTPTPVQITTLPPYPKGKAVRWNLWILDAIRDELTSLAAERGVSPSQLVQEFLWKVLSDHRSPTP